MLTRLREAFGTKVELPSLDDGDSVILHTFPSPDKLCDIDDKVLRDLHRPHRRKAVEQVLGHLEDIRARVEACSRFEEDDGAPLPLLPQQ